MHRLALITSGFALVLIGLGGAVRSTDSGLACPTWPGCFSAGDWVPPANLNVWLEHSHRLVAGVVGLLIAALTVWVLARFRDRPELLWPTLAAAVLVNVQALLGAFVVWRQLDAELVTAHLGMAMIVLACVLWVTVATGVEPAAGAGGSRLARASAGVAGLAFAQILVGGHVSGIGAGLAYRDFPLTDGALVPAISSEGELFHVLHRVLAYSLALAVVWLTVLAASEARRWRSEGATDGRLRWLVRLPRIATALVVVQIALGVANLGSNLAWFTVTPHLVVASWIWATLVLQAYLARRLVGSPGVPQRIDEPSLGRVRA